MRKLLTAVWSVATHRRPTNGSEPQANQERSPSSPRLRADNAGAASHEKRLTHSTMSRATDATNQKRRRSGDTVCSIKGGAGGARSGCISQRRGARLETSCSLRPGEVEV